MGTFDTLMKRNKDFAVEQSASGLLMSALPRALPNVKALIIGCADMRVDPAHVLGIKPGEAVAFGDKAFLLNVSDVAKVVYLLPRSARQSGVGGRIGVGLLIQPRRKYTCVRWLDTFEHFPEESGNA